MRHLIPNFFISTRPLGWQCSECSRAFPASGMVAITDPIPSTVSAEFNAHRCKRFRKRMRRQLEGEQNK
jgi:hypothetical protein